MVATLNHVVAYKADVLFSRIARHPSSSLPRFSRDHMSAWATLLLGLEITGLANVSFDMEDYGREPGQVRAVTFGEVTWNGHLPVAACQAAITAVELDAKRREAKEAWPMRWPLEVYGRVGDDRQRGELREHAALTDLRIGYESERLEVSYRERPDGVVGDVPRGYACNALYEHGAFTLGTAESDHFPGPEWLARVFSPIGQQP